MNALYGYAEDLALAKATREHCRQACNNSTTPVVAGTPDYKAALAERNLCYAMCDQQIPFPVEPPAPPEPNQSKAAVVITASVAVAVAVGLFLYFKK